MPETVVIPDLFDCGLVQTTEIQPDEVIAVQTLRYIVNELNNGLGVLLGLTHNVLECLENAEPAGEDPRRACCEDLRSAEAKIKQLSSLMPQHRRRRAQLPKSGDERITPPRHATILLVDNDEQIRGLLEKALTKNGFTVIEAAGGYEAIKGSQGRDSVDLLVTDLHMPVMTGSDLAAYLRLKRPDMKVIFMSGDLPETFDPKAVLLPKPFSPSALVTAVRDVLTH